MVTAGLMSPQTAIRKNFPDVDPETELGRILAARLLFSPEVMALLTQGIVEKVAVDAGLTEMLERILSQATEEPGAPSGGGIQPARRAANPENEGEAATGAGSRRDQAAGRELDLREEGV